MRAEVRDGNVFQGRTVAGVSALGDDSSVLLGCFLFLKPELAIHTRFRNSGGRGWLVSQKKVCVDAGSEVGV